MSFFNRDTIELYKALYNTAPTLYPIAKNKKIQELSSEIEKLKTLYMKEENEEKKKRIATIAKNPKT